MDKQVDGRPTDGRARYPTEIHKWSEKERKKIEVEIFKQFLRGNWVRMRFWYQGHEAPVLNLPFVASIYLDGNCLSCQLLVFHMTMEDVCLESLLIFPDVPAGQIPLNVDRVNRFSTQSGRFFAIELIRKKETRKKLEKKLSPFGWDRVSEKFMLPF